MSIDRLRKRFPDEAGQLTLLVTETTRMGETAMCVAGIDIRTGSMARPHNWNAFNWARGDYPAFFEPGAVVRGPIRRRQEPGPLPHRNEDTRLSDRPGRVGTASPDEFFAACRETAATSIAAGLRLPSIADRFVVEGTDCASLFGLRVLGRDLRLREQTKFQAPGTDFRCWLTAGSRSWDLKVTARDAEALDGRAGLRAHAAALSNGEIVVRIGLARGMPDTSPPRCYLPVNGFVFPPDS
jgi:hypothetical protein